MGNSVTDDGPGKAQDREFADGVRLIREAVEQAYGPQVFPSPEYIGDTPFEQCQAIARVIRVASERETPPAGDRSRVGRMVLGASLALMIVLATYAVWPLMGLYRLAAAVEARNAALLSDLIDFPALRRSLAEQIITAYLKLTGRDTGLGQLTEGLLVGAAANVIDPVVARIINPEAIIDLLGKGSTGEGAATASGGRAPISVAALGNAWRTWLDSEYSFRNFYVRLPPAVSPPQQFRLMLRLTAWKWKLTTLDLPEELRLQLAREVIKAKSQ